MKRFLFVAVIALVCVPLASAHIRIYPTESTYGAREKYTMRVPNEKQVGSLDEGWIVQKPARYGFNEPL